MLKLVKISDDQVEYPFLVGPKYGIGRKEQPSAPYEEPHWISLGHDSSISRIHAEMYVEHPRGNVRLIDHLPSLVVVDLGSKFNTFVRQTEDDEGETQLTAREAFRLAPGNIIQFGRIEHKYRVVYEPMIVVPSGLKKVNQEKVEEAVRELGGHVVSDWSEKCTHLAMDVVTLTVKAVCALLSSRPIVTFSYFEKLVSYTRAKQAGSLSINNFIPPWGEKTIPADSIDLTQSGRGGTLFHGSTFLCWTDDQMTKLFPAISSGGGVLKLLSDCSLKDVASAKVLLLQPPAGFKLDASSKTLRDAYQKANKRVINQNEISLAAVYRDTTKHCNPQHDFKPKVFPTMASQTQQQASAPVLVPETQPPETMSSFGSRNVIEESFAESQNDSSALPGTSTDANSAVRRGIKHSAEDNIEAPSPKRRSTIQPGQGENSVNTSLSLSRARFGRNTQSNNKTLSKIFGVSDSDEDERSKEENSSSAVATTRSRVAKVTSDSTPRRTSPRKRPAATLADDDDETEPAVIRGTPSPPPTNQGCPKRSRNPGRTKETSTRLRAEPELKHIDEGTGFDDNDAAMPPPKKQPNLNELATVPMGSTLSRMETLPMMTPFAAVPQRASPLDNESSLNSDVSSNKKRDSRLENVTDSVAKINLALVKEEKDEKPDINLPTAKVLEVALVKFEGRPARPVAANGNGLNYKGFRKNVGSSPAPKPRVPLPLSLTGTKPKYVPVEEEPSTSTKNSSQQENMLLESSPEPPPIASSKRTLRSGSKSPTKSNKPTGKGPRQFNYQKKTSSPRETQAPERVADPSEGLFDF